MSKAVKAVLLGLPEVHCLLFLAQTATSQLQNSRRHEILWNERCDFGPRILRLPLVIFLISFLCVVGCSLATYQFSKEAERVYHLAGCNVYIVSTVQHQTKFFMKPQKCTFLYSQATSIYYKTCGERSDSKSPLVKKL